MAEASNSKFGMQLGFAEAPVAARGQGVPGQSINGFLLFRKDRVKRKGGGVCVYVKESLNPMVISERCTLENSEMLFLRIKHSELSYLLCACYHPPRPKYNNTAIC